MKIRNCFLLVVFLTLAALGNGCAVGRYATINEVSQVDVASPNFRPGARVLAVNHYQATWSELYIIRGVLRDQEEIIANRDCLPVIVKERYMGKVVLGRAIGKWITVKNIVLDAGSSYTILEVVYGNVLMRRQIYSYSFHYVQTDRNPLATWWEHPYFHHRYWANQVIQVYGADYLGPDHLSLDITVYPNRYIHEFINLLAEAGGGEK